jgi:DNA-binding response OmpR family regulator
MRIHALLVDDDPVFARACRTMLASHAHRLDWAYSAEQAHHHILLHPKRYRVILLDLHMPTVGGRHLIKSLRVAGVTTPIIVVTANKKKASRTALLKSGVHAYIVKPFTSETLFGAIHAAV